MPEINEQLAASIKLVFDLTSRIDERVKILVEQHTEVNQRIEKIMERQENMLTRISVLETKGTNGLKEDVYELEKVQHNIEVKVAALELDTTRHENKWRTAGDFVFKTIITIIGAVVAWKLSSK